MGMGLDHIPKDAMLRITARESEECEQQRWKRQLISIAQDRSLCRSSGSLSFFLETTSTRELSCLLARSHTHLSLSLHTLSISLFACVREALSLSYINTSERAREPASGALTLNDKTTNRIKAATS